MKWYKLIVSSLIVLSLLGCENLIIREGDSETEVSNKQGARILAGILTLGISELAIRVTESRENERQRFVREMDSLIGKMTYDDALSALGPPTQVEKGQDVMVASWDTQHRDPDIVSLKHGIVFHGDSYRQGLMLWFDTRTGVLKKWDFRTR